MDMNGVKHVENIKKENKMEYYHKTRNGEFILLSEMTDNHLLNTIKMMQRIAKEGKIIIYKNNDIWDNYEEEIYDSEEMLNCMRYDLYINEAEKRGLIR